MQIKIVVYVLLNAESIKKNCFDLRFYALFRKCWLERFDVRLILHIFDGKFKILWNELALSEEWQKACSFWQCLKYVSGGQNVCHCNCENNRICTLSWTYGLRRS